MKFLGKTRVQSIRRADTWMVSPSFWLTGGTKRSILNFLEGFIGMWIFLLIPRWLRPYCMYFLVLSLPFGTFVFWLLFLKNGSLLGSSASYPSFSLFPVLLGETSWLRFCLVHLKSILYTQVPARSIQNKHTCHFSTQNPLAASHNFSSKCCLFRGGILGGGVVGVTSTCNPLAKIISVTPPTSNVLVDSPVCQETGNAPVGEVQAP